MKSNVKVSVITVVYNDVKNIEKTIKNVLKQTYTNLEYVVVDGASKDGTLDIIKRYEGKLRWISEPDKGIYDAMQKGAEMATGEWIIFRNCGDYFIHPSAIENVFNCYTDDKKEDLLIANTRFFKNYGYKDAKPSILTKHYFDAMPMLHPSTFVRRTVQLKYPFHLEYRNSADYCFFIECLINGAKWRFFDILIALFDNRLGASSENYGRSIQDNIDILKHFNAPVSKIKHLEKVFADYRLRTTLKKFMPFYNLYHKYNLRKNGWTKESLDMVLKDI